MVVWNIHFKVKLNMPYGESGWYDVVDVWIGYFDNAETFTAYFEETYTDAETGEPETPISTFAAEQGQHFHDHDWLVFERLETDTHDIDKLLERCPCSMSYRDQVHTAAQVETRSLNTILTYFTDDFKAPRSVNQSDYWIRYLGRFETNPRARMVNQVDDQA